MKSRLILLPVLGLAVLGLALGPIGAKLLGFERLIDAPAVHLAPQKIFTIGGFTVTNTLLSAWLTCIVILLLFGLGSRRMAMVPGRLQGFLEVLVEALYGFIRGMAGERYARRFFPLLATIFVFVAFNAWMALLPIYPTVGFKAEGADHVTTHLLRSAGTDINMPLALALIAFVFIEVWGFRVHRFGYLREFFRFGNPVQTFIGLLELISHFIRIISFTFRLFGNMLAGEIVLFMMTFLTFFVTPIIFYGLEILVGGVQALVFMGLTLVFTVLAVAPHEGHQEGHAEAGQQH
ncbi:MAG: F0F1 ATP synthase subunit A [Chloroflexota bacterium]|nr:F0F1 ATP synthase subunit A [Chloroflexota bacterium]